MILIQAIRNAMVNDLVGGVTVAGKGRVVTP
jgi:hypothetical protein